MIQDATALAAAIKEKRLTAMDAMQASLDAAATFDHLGAIAHLDRRMGIAAARAIDAQHSVDPQRFGAQAFAGVPTLAKDLGGPFAGLPVTAGSRLFKREGGEADSDLAARFRDAGFCLFGLTTSPEFGLSLASEPAIGPICRNPLDQTLTAGGSSGGAAAAVAAGIVSIAHATDAGGSIRIPAACCGLVGLKPGRGVIPAGPDFGNHLGGIASELAVTRSVHDAATMFEILRGRTKGPFADNEPQSVENMPLRIGVLTDTGTRFPTDSTRCNVVELAALSLEAAGHQLVPLAWSDFETIVTTSAKVFGDIVAVNLANFVAALDLDIIKAETLTQAFVMHGKTMTATALWNALNAGVLVSRDLWTIFDRVDAVVMPMLARKPLPIGSFPSDHSDIDLHLDRMTGFAPTAALANISGFPAITLPFGTDDEGLPLPVQMIVPMGHEPLLLALAARLEAEGRWQHKFPIAGLAA